MPINPEGGFETELERDIRMSRKRYANRVYTNANKSLVDQRFRVFHCKRCTSYVLITDADIQTAPRRRTDNAIVFCPEKNFVKLRTRPIPEPVKVRRLKGIETQYLHACADCGLHIAYQSVPHSQSVKNTSPTPVSGEVSSSSSTTPTTTASSPGSGSTSSPSPASAAPKQTEATAVSSGGAKSSAGAGALAEGQSKSSVDSENNDSSTAATLPASSAVSREKAATPVASADDSTSVMSASASTGSCGTTPTGVSATSSATQDGSAVSKQTPKKNNSPVSAPLIYLIETAVIFPTKVTQIRMRCRICGFVPRNEMHFEEHKRDRGHWDQDSGQFTPQEDSGDTPINPIIVG